MVENSKKYSIFIDESCHLENDKMPLMCIGYVKIPSQKYNELKTGIKKIKLKHKTPTEIKWNKLNVNKLKLYKDIIDFVFDHEIYFRAILVKNKNQLDHEKFNRGDHNSFYYTLIYYLLKNPFVNKTNTDCRVILDIKDTRGKERLNKLDERLNREYSYSHNAKSPFNFFQHIRSEENEFLQLADLLIGSITYKARSLEKKPGASRAKIEVVNYLEEKSGYKLDDGTYPSEEKFNIFDFQLQKSN